AVGAVCEAIVHILHTTMRAEEAELNFASINPTFEVYSGQDFSDTESSRRITSGASVLLYRVLPNLNHRTPAGRFLPDGRRQRSQLPLDLHIIVTMWGRDPNTQNRLVGWVLRTLEDYSALPASVLNVGRSTPVFGDEESVELTIGEMEGDELLTLWDMLGHHERYYQISIPYVARNIYIESHRVEEAGTDVQIRTLDLRRMING
ncbi:MAG: DUF4255 domain-containing protein, partial [Litorilinea sp.]